MRRWLLIFAPLALTVIVVIVLLQTLKPRLEAWALKTFVDFSKAELPVIIEAEAFELDFFLPEARLKQIKVTAKPELNLEAAKLQAQLVTAKLDLLSLLAGKIQLSGVILEGLQARLDIDPYLKNDSKPQVIDWNPIFDLIRKIPLGRLALKNSGVEILSRKEKFSLDLIDFDLLLIKGRDRLQLRLDVEDADFTLNQLASPFRFQTDAVLSRQGLEFTEIRLLGLGSLLQGQVAFSDLPQLLVKPTVNAQLESRVSLPQLAQLLSSTLKIPTVSGQIELKGQVQVQGGELSTGHLEFLGQNLKISKFEIGDLEATARGTSHEISFPTFKMRHPSGEATAQGMVLAIEHQNGKLEKLHLRTQVKTESVDLHELLYRLGIGDLPLDAFIAGEAKCEGPLWPQTHFQCQGEASGEQIEVRAGKNDISLVQVEEARTKGQVTIDRDKVSYEADIFAGQDQGKSSGVISYEKGFQISYTTPSLDFQKVGNKIANLKLEGKVAVTGRTWGNADWGEFEMKLSGQGFNFEDFQLGDVKTFAHYKSGHLYFDEIEGTKGASLYRGELEVDLKNDRLIASGKSDRLDLVDVSQILERRLKIPVEITGTGVGEVQLSGPFQVNRLTYTAQARMSKVTVAGETFDQVSVKAKSVDGEFEFEEASASKGAHKIQLRGKGHPDGQIEFQAFGQSLPLEQSENISLVGSNMSGLMDFTLDITHQIRDPHLLLKTQIRNVIIEEQELPTTNAEVAITSNSMRGDVSLVGGRLESKFQIPFKEEEPFRFWMRANDWNYTTFFALLGAGSLLSEYQASLTATVDLKAEQGGFWRSSGKAEIQKVTLQRSGLSLENPKQMEISVQNGIFSFENFELKGPSTQIQILGTKNRREHLDIQMKAESELRLFQIFLPFLEELSGKAKLVVNLGGSLNEPELLGSGQTENGYVKLKGFPHAIEKINSEVQFSQSKVLINSVRGEMAGGIVTGEGNLMIKGMRDIPTQIRLQLQSVSMNVPDRVRTEGNAELNLSGNWFPFVLSGTYRVQGGLVDKEFGEEGLQNQIQKSSYLPKMILQKAFEPVLLDLQVILDQPLAVRNSLMDGAVAGTLQVKGPPSSPLLFGQITAEKSTKLLFRDKVFEATTMNIKFSDPKEINPELYIAARSRINEYDVNLLVQGTAKAPIVRMSSLPPLPESEIVSLLALGVTTQSQEKRSLNKDTQGAGTYQLGTAVLQQIPLFKKAQKATGFNVQFSSNYDDTKNVEVKKVTIARQVSDKMKVSASRLAGDQSSNQFKIEYSLNPSVSAIGTWQQNEATERTSLQENQTSTESVLGLDLEFRKEFR